MKTLGLLALAILLIVEVVAGASLYAKSTTAKIRVEGMACEKCAARIERVLSKMDGVEKAEVKFKEKTAYVRYDDAKVSLKQIQGKVREIGYTVQEEAAASRPKHIGYAP